MSKYAVVIPTLNAGAQAYELIAALKGQAETLPRVIVIDSGSTDETADVMRAAGFEVHPIRPHDFDHGKTRNLGRALASPADVVVFLTQDALPADSDSIASIVSPFVDSSIGLVCGRQLQRLQAGPIESHARYFNYPATSNCRVMPNAALLGVKAIFNSNSFAAYRTQALDEVGGFPNHIIMGEDQIAAGRLLLRGWKVVYQADAAVRHSHDYSIIEEFKRYFDIGVFHDDQQELMAHFGPAESEGWKFVSSEIKYLWSRSPRHIPESILRNMMKLTGYKIGRNQRYLPGTLKRAVAMNGNYFKSGVGNQAIKVLHIVETARGGCGTYLNELVPFQLKDPLIKEIRIVAPDRHLAILEDVPPSIIDVFHRPGRFLGLIQLTLTAGKSIYRFRPDVIHAHSTFAGVIIRLFAMLLPRMPPIVYCSHGWAFTKEQSFLTRRLAAFMERILCFGSKIIVVISEAERQEAQQAGIDARQLVVIYNGIGKLPLDLEKAAWVDQRLKVLFVGRLDRQKGVDILLDAVKALEGQVCLRIVGEAVVSDPLRFDQSLKHIEYVGWMNRIGVARQIAAADVIVMPSRWEGFGLVAVEAMRAAKPVIASSVGGLAEVVVDMKTGRLVPPNDAAALRAALLADTRQQRESMGQAGRERFQEMFTIEIMQEAIINVYLEVCNRRADITMRPKNLHPTKSETFRAIPE